MNQSAKAIGLMQDIHLASKQEDFATIITDAQWEALEQLFSLDYWDRVWIIQELALNRNMTLFLWGPFQFSREVIISACSACLGTNSQEGHPLTFLYLGTAIQVSNSMENLSLLRIISVGYST